MWMIVRFFWNLILVVFAFAVVFTLIDRWYYDYAWFAWIPKMQHDHETILLLSVLIAFIALITTALEQARNE
jgi:hypothetical protein